MTPTKSQKFQSVPFSAALCRVKLAAGDALQWAAAAGLEVTGGAEVAGKAEAAGPTSGVGLERRLAGRRALRHGGRCADKGSAAQEVAAVARGYSRRKVPKHLF